MSRYAAFVVIAFMSIGLVFLLVTRTRSPHDAPAEIITEPSIVDAAVDAPAKALVDAAPPPPPAEKIVRVTALGWELVAPGVALVHGVGAGDAAAPPFELAPESSLEALEARLARGGADLQGADVAVLPLPAFVASFDRLRALEPRAFAIVGFSRGREELHAAAGSMQKVATTTDDVKLVALGPTTAGDAAARTVGSDSATVLGLFAVDLLGVSSRLKIVGPSSPEAKSAPFAAVIRGTPDERPRAFSTADASRLVPIVAVAPKAVLDARTAALKAWAASWFEGQARAKRDVPGVARRLASKENLPLAKGVADADGALALVERLGQLDDITLEQQTTFIGPLAKGEITLEKLMHRTWRLARTGGLTAAASPDPLPIDARIVPSSAAPPSVSPSSTDVDAGAFGAVSTGAVTNVTYRPATTDPNEIATEIAFLAGVFERGIFKISARGGDKAAKAIAESAREKGVPSKRLVTAAGDPASTAVAVVEVLSPP